MNTQHATLTTAAHRRAATTPPAHPTPTIAPPTAALPVEQVDCPKCGQILANIADRKPSPIGDVYLTNMGQGTYYLGPCACNTFTAWADFAAPLPSIIAARSRAYARTQAARAMSEGE